MNIVAVVVTYNRRQLLARCLDALRANRSVGHIIVVNNGSTDDTAGYLLTQASPALTVITQENVGGSGGFARGISEALALGADWIWCMDDDVRPRPDCLERLLPHAADPAVGMLAPRRLVDGEVYSNDFLAYNLTRPFRSLYSGRLRHRPVSRPTDIAGTAFEGPLIRREAALQVGLPNRELFIFCDDTDYCLRTVRAGWRIRYIPDALMDKEHFFTHDTWAGRNRKKKWKRYYQIRNSAYLNHHYGLNPAVRYLRPLIGMAGYVLTALLTAPFTRAYSLGDIPRMWRAYTDGIHERLGKM